MSAITAVGNVSSLFRFGDDLLTSFLSVWLDVQSLLVLDIAVSGKRDRLLWLERLRTVQSIPMNKLRHNHSSIRWLISRNFRSVERIEIALDATWQIVDASFEGILLPALWNIDLTGCQRVSDATLSHLMTGCPQLSSIDITDCKNITDKGVTALAAHYPDLQELSINGCYKITSASVETLGELCLNLNMISFDGCFRITDAGLFRLATLRHLTTISCRRFNRKFPRAIDGDYLMNIRELNGDELYCAMDGSQRITHEGISRLTRGCPALEDVDISGHKILPEAISMLPKLRALCTQSSKDMCEDSLVALADGCPLLQSADLSLCYNLNVAGVSALGRGCHQLRSICLRGSCGSYWIDTPLNMDAGISVLAEGCPDLRQIYLPRGVTHYAVTSLIFFCPKLQFISFGDSDWLADESLVALSSGSTELQVFEYTVQCQFHRGRKVYAAASEITDEGISALVQNCRGLLRIHLGNSILNGTGFKFARCRLQILNMESAPQLTDSGLSDIAHGCPDLHTVVFGLCEHLTDEGLSSLALGCPLMQNITLSMCPKITDAGVIRLAKSCSKLRYVTIKDSAVTDAAVQSLAQCCPHLRDLELNTRSLTDAGLIAMAKGFPRLRSMCCERSLQLTDAGLTALANGCKRLQKVVLTGNRKVSDVGLIALVHGCPELHHVDLSGTNVTDTSIIALAQGCPNLLHISYNSCSAVTAASLFALAENCPNLLLIGANGCEATTESIQAVLDRCLALEKMNMSNCVGIVDDKQLNTSKNLNFEGILTLQDSCAIY